MAPVNAITRLALVSLPSGAILAALLWLSARLLPPMGLLLYVPTVAGLELLEGEGYATLSGSPDGWPVPTLLGWWISGAGWWAICSMAVLASLILKRRRAKRIVEAA
jgi:hypothetical protein